MKDRILALKERLAQAASRSGREAEEITLIAVSKTQPLNLIEEAVDSGLVVDLGENRVQEGMDKIPCWPTDKPVRWHLIGQLQRNKARRAMELFHMIQSVESEKLIDRLQTLGVEMGIHKPVLLEVNTSMESAKHGCTLEEAPCLAERLASCDHLDWQGLMTIGPLTDDRDAVRRAFASLRHCAEDLRRRTGLALPVLSMGMSGDFELAIEEGSTMVRVGTAIFGQRV